MLNVFSIKDSKADAYMTPFFMMNDQLALRAFSDLANDKSHPVGQHPEDYHLCRIGAFDERTGELGGDMPPVVLSSASSVVKYSLPLGQQEMLKEEDLDAEAAALGVNEFPSLVDDPEGRN